MMTPRALLPGLAALLVACSQPLTVEQQVITVIRQMEEKIEAGERRAFMAHIADDFSGQGGRMNRDQARALVVFQLRRFERLQAQLFPITVTETGRDTATAEFRALVTGGPHEAGPALAGTKPAIAAASAGSVISTLAIASLIQSWNRSSSSEKRSSGVQARPVSR